jgi:streptogramin lyase
VNIACSGKGTVVRFDAITGEVVGEYSTAPAGMGKNPSRTTVDKYGNCWVTNRSESSSSGGFPKGSVTRIGIVIGGTRCDAAGNPDPNGEYLKPPFVYNTCIDRNNDGLIRTSRGLGNVLAWNNPMGVNTNGGVSGAEDEAIINYTRVLAVGARTIAIDEFNDVWVGGSVNRYHEKISDSTGTVVPGSAWNIGQGGYGGFIDGNGVLWSSGQPDNNPLVRFDPNGPSFPSATALFGRGDYGLGVDPNTGEIWHTFVSGNAVCKIAPDGTVLGTYSHGSFHSQGVAVDAVGNVWVAHSLLGNNTTVGHLRTDGTFVGNVPLPGSGPTGVAVDAFGKIWVSCYDSDIAVRINPNAGPIGGGGYPVGEVDLVVNLGPGASPYNYSDMTGYVVINSTVPSGTWTVIHDGQEAGRKWGQIDWNDSIPPSTGIFVQARASDDLLTLASKPFRDIEKGASFCCQDISGRYIEVRVTLFRQATVNLTPVLYDLTIQCCDIYPNTPPSISASISCGTQDTLRIAAGQPRTFTVFASDADSGQTVTIGYENLPAGSTFTADTTLTGNNAQSVFEWTPSLSQLGVYNVIFTAYDDYCYTDKCETVIEVVPCPTISCSGAGISCVSLCNGRAEVSLSGNPPGFTFTWNTTPPSNDTLVKNLCPGTYTVYSSDNYACFDSCIIVIPATPCDGFVTYTQGGYGYKPSGNNPAMYVKNNFNAVFPNGLVIGCNNTITLTNFRAVHTFLPSSGTPALLPAGNWINPPSTYKNTLAGQLVAAKLNVGFDSASVSFAPATGSVGDLIMVGGPFDGWTVREIIAEADRAIGGCGSSYTLTQLNLALTRFNENYNPTTSNTAVNNCYFSCPITGSGSLKNENTVLASKGLEWEIVPNPANESANINFQVSTDGQYKFELLDPNGRLIAELFNGSIAAFEEQNIPVDLSNINNGIYLVRISGVNLAELKRLVVVK